MSQSFDKASALARFQDHLDAVIEAVEAKQSKQSSRPVSDSWENVLKDLELKPDARHNVTQAIDADDNTEWRVRSSYLLTNVIGIAPERVGAVHQRRLGTVMRKLGWTGPKNIKFGRTQARRRFRHEQGARTHARQLRKGAAPDA